MNKPKSKSAVKKPATKKSAKALKINTSFDKVLKVLATPKKNKG